MDVLLTGRVVSAREALSIGWVSRICEPGTALQKAREIAQGIASLPGVSMRGIKRSARAAYRLDLDEALTLEMELFHETLTTGEVPRRVEAFLGRKMGARER
jgi:enoyl-CoA hydratase